MISLFGFQTQTLTKMKSQFSLMIKTNQFLLNSIKPIPNRIVSLIHTFTTVVQTHQSEKTL